MGPQTDLGALCRFRRRPRREDWCSGSGSAGHPVAVPDPVPGRPKIRTPSPFIGAPFPHRQLPRRITNLRSRIDKRRTQLVGQPADDDSPWAHEYAVCVSPKKTQYIESSTEMAGPAAVVILRPACKPKSCHPRRITQMGDEKRLRDPDTFKQRQFLSNEG